jgi:hypothetical protein
MIWKTKNKFLWFNYPLAYQFLCPFIENNGNIGLTYLVTGKTGYLRANEHILGPPPTGITLLALFLLFSESSSNLLSNL